MILSYVNDHTIRCLKEDWKVLYKHAVDLFENEKIYVLELMLR